MVDGGYQKYGFDDISIDQFRNLILLEKSINNTLKNKSPNDKLNGWETSSLYDYYKEYINYIIENKTVRQTDRLYKLAKSLCEYLLEAFPAHGILKKGKFINILQVNRHYGQYTGVTSNISVNKDTANSEKYLFVLDDNYYMKRFPEPKENSTLEYHLVIKGRYGTANDCRNYKEEEYPDGKEFSLKLLGLMLFIHCMKVLIEDNEDPEKVIYEIITNYAKRKGNNGKNLGEILFTDQNVKNGDIRIDKKMKKYIRKGRALGTLAGNGRVGSSLYKWT